MTKSTAPAPKSSGAGTNSGNSTFNDREKPKQIRDSNITAAKGMKAVSHIWE